MTNRSLLLTGVLALSSLSIASAKSYDIVISEPSEAAGVQIPAGEYRVKVEGTNAVFTSVTNGKQMTAPVKIENTGKKHDQTAVDTSNINGTEQLRAIELGGSPNTLEFGGE